MPRFPGFPEKPHYNSVKAYLSVLAKDIAEMVVDPIKMNRFREQLKKYEEFRQEWTIYKDADQDGCWKPEMGRPECIFNVFSRPYYTLKDTEKEAKRLAGSYALCALIHDSQLPHLDKINTDIIPVEAVEETLSAPRSMLEGSYTTLVDAEIYLIEEFFNRVRVDLQEFCNLEENKSTQASIEEQIQKASQLSDEDFLKLTAKKFEERAKKRLSKDETWYDLDRSLKGWFDSAIARLENNGLKDKTVLLKYLYTTLISFARNTNIMSFRGFSELGGNTSKAASELASKFEDFAQSAKVSLKDAKADIPTTSNENNFDTIAELIKEKYLLENGDDLGQKIAETVQDSIRQGTASTTVCVSKQLQVYIEHNNKLIDHIIESLKQDFADIPLINFKEKLLTIVDEEYNKLIPIASSYLVKVGLAQTAILKSAEQQINKKKKIAKQLIETRFAIIEKQKGTFKDKRESPIIDTAKSQTNIDINSNFIKASIKHLPCFGPYLFDLIYGVDGVKTQKKENKSIAISRRQKTGTKDKQKSVETGQRNIINRKSKWISVPAIIAYVLMILTFLFTFVIKIPPFWDFSKNNSGDIPTAVTSDNKIIAEEDLSISIDEYVGLDQLANSSKESAQLENEIKYLQEKTIRLEEKLAQIQSTVNAEKQKNDLTAQIKDLIGQAEEKRKIKELMSKASTAINERDYATAIKCYKELIEVHEVVQTSFYNNWGAALSNLAILERDIEKKRQLFKDSCKIHERAVQIFPNYHGFSNNWGISLMNLAATEKPDEAIKQQLLIEACSKFEKSAQQFGSYLTYNNWGNGLSKLGGLEKDADKRRQHFEDAYSKFEKAIEICPDYYFTYLNWSGTLKNFSEFESDPEEKRRLMGESEEKRKKAEEIKKRLDEGN